LLHENRYLDNFRKVEYWGGELAQCDPSLNLSIQKGINMRAYVRGRDGRFTHFKSFMHLEINRLICLTYIHRFKFQRPSPNWGPAKLLICSVEHLGVALHQTPRLGYCDEI